MQSNGETAHFMQSSSMQSSVQNVTVFDADSAPRTFALMHFGKPIVTFGRQEDNDIVLASPLVSRHHGRFVLINGIWRIEDTGSMNGLLYHHTKFQSREISSGDFIRIDSGAKTVASGVLFMFSASDSENRWFSLPLTAEDITIGRAAGNTILLPHVSVSQQHARIALENGKYYIYDTGSTNGVIVNGVRISGKASLHEKDVITITNSKLIFSGQAIHYYCCRGGITVETSDAVILRSQKGKKIVTCNHVDLNIRPGELVAIIGGSGAGKSTVLNCMCGYLPPDNGAVYINGIDLYRNFDSLKKLIGYVPQSDIVYDNLTLYDMLKYTAELRLAKDVTPAEREQMIARAIETVELTDKRDSLIKRLSGGQKKRASIAVELLSDPNLLFLDEPASGLDPGTERNLMLSLRKMANNGKTVILVTHSTLQLRLCDKIVFMGKGGNLCFCGSYDEALTFFGVSDIVDIYNMITENAPEWRAKYYEMSAHKTVHKDDSKTVPSSSGTSDGGRQFRVLCARYTKLIVNDRQRLLLILLQAPLLALLISFVANGKQFEQYEITKSLLFALACSAFWIGMLNAIQEICKERSVLKREYMTGLSLTAYVASKITVLGILSLIQSLMVSGIFGALVGLPDEGILLFPYGEILITTFLAAAASAAMGLLVSSLFTNADRAMTVAPLLLMPQILFSGLIFKLEGISEMISVFAICRWSMEGYGTTADLNSLPLRLQEEGFPMLPHLAEDFFDYTVEHMLASWLILLLFTVGFLLLARLILGRIGKEKS